MEKYKFCKFEMVMTPRNLCVNFLCVRLFIAWHSILAVVVLCDRCCVIDNAGSCFDSCCHQAVVVAAEGEDCHQPEGEGVEEGFRHLLEEEAVEVGQRHRLVVEVEGW